MGLDIRLPIGLLFSILGLLLMGFGALSNNLIYQRSLGININVWCGAVMLAFGIVIFVLGQRGSKLRNESKSAACLDPALKSNEM